MINMEHGMRKENISFIPFGTELLSWAVEKDRRYHNGDKLNKGIVSYVAALHDLGFFFKKVRMGELRANSQTVSAWARMWGWDYRKALRFITIVLRDLFDLNTALKKAKVLRERLEAALAKQQEKMRSYMRKLRGSTSLDTQSYAQDDETEDERLFLDAMAALAKTSPVFYRAKIKKQLRAKDIATWNNFQKWLEKHKKPLAEFLPKSTIPNADIFEILRTKRISGYRVINYSKKDENIYHIVFDNYFETDMTAEQIIENAQ
jgi:hypothetical protein